MREIGSSRRKVIRVVLADVPQLLAAIVRKAVEAENDIVIVAEVKSAEATENVVGDPVDAIITATQKGALAPPFCAAVFGARAIPILAVSVDGSSIDVYSRTHTHGYGLKDLVDLIREAVSASGPRSGC